MALLGRFLLRRRSIACRCHIYRFLESFWDEQLRLLKHEAETEERHAPLKCLPRNIPSLGNLPQREVALIMLLSSGLDLGYLFQTKFLDQLCA